MFGSLALAGQVGVPEQARGDGPPGPPRLGDRRLLRFGRQSGQALRSPHRAREGEVAGGPDVGAAQGHQQVDVGAPPPDAHDAREHRPRVVVIRRGDRIKVEPAIEHVACQPDEIARLLPGLASSAEALFPDDDDLCGLYTARRQDESAERRVRGGERDLLLEDDPDEGLEPWLASPQRRGSVALGDAGQVGVDAG